MLSGKSAISDLFYCKTGIPCAEGLSKTMRVKDLTRKKCEANRWNERYRDMYQRLLQLENRFKSNKLQMVNVAGTTFYFVPMQEML